VDVLELSVGDRGTGDRGRIFEVDELHQVLDESGHPILWWRDERGVGGAQRAPTDPVLLASKRSAPSPLGAPVIEVVAHSLLQADSS